MPRRNGTAVDAATVGIVVRNAAADAWATLGLDGRTATEGDVRGAKRQLAKQLHPDILMGRGASPTELHDAAERLMAVQRAVEVALGDLTSRGPDPVLNRGRDSSPDFEPFHGVAVPGTGFGQWTPAPPPGRVADDLGFVEADATFGISLLPAEAFELLLLAFSSIGDPKIVEEPYLLEGMVDDPCLGHARVRLVPDAGGSIVTVETAPFGRGSGPPPAPEVVAGRLIAEMRNFA